SSNPESESLIGSVSCRISGLTKIHTSYAVALFGSFFQACIEGEELLFGSLKSSSFTGCSSTISLPSVPQTRKGVSFEAETVSSRFLTPEATKERFRRVGIVISRVPAGRHSSTSQYHHRNSR